MDSELTFDEQVHHATRGLQQELADFDVVESRTTARAKTELTLATESATASLTLAALPSPAMLPSPDMSVGAVQQATEAASVAP